MVLLGCGVFCCFCLGFFCFGFFSLVWVFGGGVCVVFFACLVFFLLLPGLGGADIPFYISYLEFSAIIFYYLLALQLLPTTAVLLPNVFSLQSLSHYIIALRVDK